MFSEVQPEAQESEALIWTGHQQHQEMLYDALRERSCGSDTWHDRRMTAASGGQTWYKWARMRSWDRIFGIVSWNSWILFFSSASCSAVTPHWPWIRHSDYNTFTFQSLSAYPELWPHYLLLSLLLPLFILQAEGKLLQGWAVEWVLGALELDDLVKYCP